MTNKDLFGEKAKKADNASEYSEGFERWWKLYPAHRRREKVKCFETWRKRNLEGRAAELVDKLRADIDHDPAWQPDNRGKQFIPLSKTYLNGGRYDDDAPKPRRAMPGQSLPDEPPAPELPWDERMLNRLGLVYIRRARGLPETDGLVDVKHEVLREVAPALREDVATAENDEARKEALRESAVTLAGMFLARLDQRYGLALREPILDASQGRTT